MRRLLCAIILVGLSAGLLAGCGGPTRSVASYCNYFRTEGNNLRQHYAPLAHDASSNPLQAIAMLLTSPKDLANFFHQLSLRSPSSITGDLEVLSEAYQREANEQSQAIIDPLAGLAGGLVNGLSSAPAAERVNTFTIRNCGRVTGL